MRCVTTRDSTQKGSPKKDTVEKSSKKDKKTGKDPEKGNKKSQDGNSGKKTNFRRRTNSRPISEGPDEYEDDCCWNYDRFGHWRSECPECRGYKHAVKEIASVAKEQKDRKSVQKTKTVPRTEASQSTQTASDSDIRA